MISRKQYVSAILECENAFICAIWTHKTKIKTGNMVYKYFSVISTFPWYHITQRGCCEFQYCGNTHFPVISILYGQNHIIVYKVAPACFLLIVNWPFKKAKILWEAMIGLEKSFWMIYSTTHLRTRETLPLSMDLYIFPTHCGFPSGKKNKTNKQRNRIKFQPFQGLT